MKKLENVSPLEIRGIDDGFNPHDLIEENDDEDNIYLAEYNIQPDKQKLKQIEAQTKKQFEEYGE
jgi:hypothetical protein